MKNLSLITLVVVGYLVADSCASPKPRPIHRPRKHVPGAIYPIQPEDKSIVTVRLHGPESETNDFKEISPEMTVQEFKKLVAGTLKIPVDQLILKTWTGEGFEIFEDEKPLKSYEVANTGTPVKPNPYNVIWADVKDEKYAIFSVKIQVPEDLQEIYHFGQKTIEVHWDTTIKELKELIKKEIGVNTSRQVLLKKGFLLPKALDKDDQKTLAELGIKNGQEIFLSHN